MEKITLKIILFAIFSKFWVFCMVENALHLKSGCYRTELLPGLTAEWLKPLPPNIGVDVLNPRSLKCDN